MRKQEKRRGYGWNKQRPRLALYHVPSGIHLLLLHLRELRLLLLLPTPNSPITAKTANMAIVIVRSSIT